MEVDPLSNDTERDPRELGQAVGGGCGFLAYHAEHFFWLDGHGAIKCSGLHPVSVEAPE